MAEPLKNFYGPEIPHKIADMVGAVHPEFDRRGFLAEALAGYEQLELTPRARHLAGAMARYFPPTSRRRPGSFSPPWGRPSPGGPSPVLDLLERLKDDPTTLVRRSVANNLNDIGKDHPTLLVEVCQAADRLGARDGVTRAIAVIQSCILASAVLSPERSLRGFAILTML